MERTDRSITRGIGKFIGITFIMLISGFVIGVFMMKANEHPELVISSLVIWWMAGIYFSTKLSIVMFTIGNKK